MRDGGQTHDRRRSKAFLFLLCCAAAGGAPHALQGWTSSLPSLSLAIALGGYSLLTVRRADPSAGIGANPAPADPLGNAPAAAGGTEAASPENAPTTALTAAAAQASGPESVPVVDVVVAARDEQAVIGRLVATIANLRWPEGRLRLWIVDDGSEDRTPELLAALQRRHPLLTVLRRPRNAGGGKSAALNLVLQRLEGRWMLVLDADADLPEDLLERLIPQAEAGQWSAVQLRKSVVNADENLLTRAQAMEMALDALVQEGRLASGGVAELRGNGQLLRRDALLLSGGFNEETVTDDLDLSFRLLLAGQSIGILWNPPVREEAVLRLPALWRQRQRWAEGGLQRFFDYWPQLVSDRLTPRVRLDLACFFLLQYVLPVMAAADLVASLITRTPPTVWPLSIATLLLSGLTILWSCRRPSEGPALPNPHPLHLLLGIVYLSHWFVVIPWVTLKMALLPKRLVWAKTLHTGGHPQPDDLADSLDLEGEDDLATEPGQA